MKRVLLFLLPILLIVTIVFSIFGITQIRVTEESLLDDLTRKARTVDESLIFSLKRILREKDMVSAQLLAEMFQKRERLQGAAIYDREGNLLAVTERMSTWAHKEKPYVRDVLATGQPRGALEKFGALTVYSYIAPVLDEEQSILGLSEVIYDTGYLFTSLARLWKQMSITLLVMLFLLTAIAVLIQRQIFIMPVRRLTQWFMRFQRGETDALRPFEEKGEFGKLVSEVEQVALGLRVARKVVTDEASVRVRKEEFWTEAKLRDLVQAKLGENGLFVVSNREPFMHVLDEISGETQCLRPASGVVTAIDPIMRACGGTWIAHGSTGEDRRFVNSKDKLGVPPDDIRYILKRVWLTKQEEEGYYFGFSNEGIWPLCHVTHTRPIFRETDWEWYKKVNQKFADAVLAELPSKPPFIFIQDYHFTLLGKLIKEKRPDATIAMFWHIPWPNPEVFAICPYQHEILEGMLGCDLIGFHVQYHCNNFLDTVNRLTESRVDTEKFSVVRNNRETLVRAFPISVEVSTPEHPRSDAVAMERIRREFHLQDKLVAVGVDRIDYTKGLVERILAVDRFLEKNPQYRGKFVLLQLAAPSRAHIKRYHDLIGEIDELVEKKNWKYAEGTWKPIVYLKRHFSPEDIQPYFSLADMCIVSSLHDGMNLVAKEYVAARHGREGALILSRFTGAARELTDAFLVNPYAIEEFADSIKAALEMDPKEKVRRMEAMYKIVRDNNVYRWAASIINELTALKKG
jgi:trehalose-6-phosphate synthase/uncharacterized membrane protein affecting hemolysin expression